MKKSIIKFFAVLMLAPGIVNAGGIVTNTNQSASFIRNPSQDAVIGAEATYYNPAGLAFLKNGFHLSVSNQTISQTRNIKSTFPRMNTTEFEGVVSAPLFPTVYAVFKQGRMAYSFGFNPIGGGGSANFEKGLPSFEQQVAILPASLTASGIPTSQYSLNSAFDGSSINWGLQLNASYAINEFISVSLGMRYIMANNSYVGHLKDVMINPNQPAFGASYNGTNMVSAPQFFTDAATTFTVLAGGANLFINNLTPLVNDYGSFPISSVVTDPTQLAQLQAIITAAGQNPAGMNLNTAVAVLNGAAPAFTSNANTFTGFANVTSDKKLDASQSGSGIAPVVGLNLNFSDLIVAVKYEHKATITMTNSTVIDDVGMYPDKAETANDMPSLLSIGLAYKPIPRLNLSTGVHYYFDKNADYGKSLPNADIIDNNFLEAALGVEYTITRNILVSAGYLRTQTGVNDKYHSDLSHSLNTNSIGLGGKYIFNPNFAINLGVMNTMYEEYTKDFSTYMETYNRKALTIAVGLDIKF